MWTTVDHSNYSEHWATIEKAMNLGRATNKAKIPFCYNEDRATSRFVSLKDDFVLYYYEDGANQAGFILRRNNTMDEWHAQNIRAIGDLEALLVIVREQLEAIADQLSARIIIDRPNDNLAALEERLPEEINGNDH